MSNKNMDTKLSVNFTKASTRQNITTGENISTSFGKISKYLDDLGSAAFTNSNSYATSAQGTKADSAIQTIQIGGTTQTKTNGTVNLPAYPTKSSLGLGNVNNTSDVNKPISTATQTALDTKVSKSGDTITGDLDFTGNAILRNVWGIENSSGINDGELYIEAAGNVIELVNNMFEVSASGGEGGRLRVGSDAITHLPSEFSYGDSEIRLYNNAIELTVGPLTATTGRCITLKNDGLYVGSPERKFEPPLHNSIFRGAYLGTLFTSAQKSAIANGTFDELFVGDYWTIGNVNWRIADIDYLYGYVNTHHLIIVPDTILYNTVWNSTSTTASGYAGSDIFNTGLASALTSTQNAFGSSYIMEHTNLLTNAVSSGSPTGWADYTIKISLLNQTMLLGHRGVSTAYNDYRNDGRNTVQLALFRLCPQYTRCTNWYWLSDVTQVTAAVAYASNLNVFSVTGSRGVRPYFCLKGA